MPDIEIRNLFWDDWNREHTSKHGLSVTEIETLLSGWVFGIETYKGRYQVLRINQQGRLLSFVIGADPEHQGTWYVFSARPASRRERKRYGSQTESDEQ